MPPTLAPTPTAAQDRALVAIEATIADLTTRAEAYDRGGRPKTAAVVRETVRLLRGNRETLLATRRALADD